MIEFLSCVCGVESWLIPSISPPGPEFDFLNPLHQGRFSYQAAAAKADGREAGNAGNSATKQITEVCLAAPQEYGTFRCGQYIG
jgi:hypothetical protein